MKYDYIVIGAGSAGAIIAARLTEDPNRSVLLLEAGPDYPDLDSLPVEVKHGYGPNKVVQASVVSEHRWTFVARATDAAPPMLVPRGKVTGGSSAVNAQIFLRGVPEDYDSWAEAGNDQWSYEKLLPYFRKVETDTDFQDDFHGGDGPIIVRRFKPEEWLEDEQAFYNSCLEYGFADCPDHNDPDSTGVGPTPFNNPETIRWSTAIGYLNPIRHRVNLTIKGNCLVHKVLFDGKRAIGVQVESGGEVFSVFGEEIVLSGGAIGSPHVMLLSGVGPASELATQGVSLVQDLPGVGKNLRDHPQVPLRWSTKDGFKQDVDAPRLQFTLRYTAEGSDLRNDMLIHPISYATTAVARGGEPLEPTGIGMTVTLELALGSGELKLRDTNPNVQPFLDYNYLEHEFDRKRLREGVRICMDLAKHDDFSDIVDERTVPTDADVQSDESMDAWMMREVGTSHHISGTCKMGPASDSMAVVDQFGRVYGLEGLRVADASIMPDCIRANTNVTSLMIGERMAEFMVQGQ